MKTIALCLLLFLVWCLAILHRSVAIPPEIPPAPPPAHRAVWIPKAAVGINQVVLFGSPYQRGVAAGNFEKDLIYRQEEALREQFDRFFPNRIVRVGFTLALMRWFWGLEDYFEPWMLQEIYGVSQRTSHHFDYMADRFTRQIAYHGLHEVGQWMIDNTKPFGCTVFAVPYQGSWIIGRNFDFDAGRIFDEEKVMKWVFPNKGIPFLSVTFSGMVGVVTGVNQDGVYISLNAAGSQDFRRFGTPSTLVILKALQFSHNAEEARDVLEKSTMFISDIFVVADRSGALYRIEKTPRRVRSAKLTSATVVTNHLIDPIFKNDRVNLSREKRGSTVLRYRRGQELLATLKGKNENASQLEDSLLGFLRDRHDDKGNQLAPGDPRAIDAFVATHSVIYDTALNTIYVSRGPAVEGPYYGFDLTKSFASHQPVRIRELPRNPEISDDLFYSIRRER